jgi:DNA-binding response OmpR family regulator
MPLFQRPAPPTAGHILLLDDEPPIRESLSRFLQGRGYHVQSARNAGEAFEAINENLRAAILDVLLVNSGGKSGLDVLTRIRSTAAVQDVPVLMFTGFGLSPEVLSAIQENRADLLHKPLSFNVLGEWLKKHIAE